MTKTKKKKICSTVSHVLFYIIKRLYVGDFVWLFSLNFKKD